MRALAPLLLLAVIWAMTATAMYVNLHRRVRGLDEPVLMLPRRERRQHARELLKRESDEYTQSIIEKTTNYLRGESA